MTENLIKSPIPKATILLVEDAPFVRQSMAVFLEEFDYQILQAENGSEGLELLIQKLPGRSHP